MSNDAHLIDFERAGRITASVVAAILRIDPTHSRKWAWRVITGREPDRPNADMQRGVEHEADAIFGFECESGLLSEPGHFIPHPEFEWLGASPDAVVQEGGEYLVPVEAKCPRVLHGDVPAKYQAQIQTQMQCMSAPHGYFVSWTDGGLWVCKVVRDDAWWTEHFPHLKEFYEQYVLPDIEPPRAARRKKDGT